MEFIAKIARMKKYIIGGSILVLAVGYLLYLSLGSSVSYYVTVSEFMGRDSELRNTNIRIAGKIVESIHWDTQNLELKFTISEGGNTLPVVYQGAKPSGFKAGSNVLVEGKYQADRIFHATQLIMQCPSKYVPEE